MEKRHPNLKNINDEEQRQKPKYADSSNIFSFINNYIEWMQDEWLTAKRTYTRKEQIDHVLNELDDSFKEAKQSMREDIRLLNLNSDNPKPFPQKLHVDEKLGPYIMSILSPTTRDKIYDTITIDISDDDSDTDNNTPMIRALKKGDRNKGTFNPKQRGQNNSYGQRKDTKWAKNIKWEIQPGEQCPACGKCNHNVYKTGCPSLSQFAVCKEFYDKTPKELLDSVIDSYKQYQKELKEKLRQQRNNDRKAIRTLTERYQNDDDIAEIKKTFFKAYVDDYPEEQFLESNPYCTLEDEDNDDNHA